MRRLSHSERVLYCAAYEDYIERAEKAFDESDVDCPRCPDTNAYEVPDFANDAHRYATRMVQRKRDGFVEDPNFDPFIEESA